MKDLIIKIEKMSAKLNQMAKIILHKEVPPNLDLQQQCKLQMKYFKLLNQLKEVCRQRNLKMMMLTLIVYHSKSDSLNKTYKILQTATRKLFYSVEFKNFLKLLSAKYQIKKLEVDFADVTGWHPHYHCLLIAENSIAIESVAEYEKKFSSKFFQCCVSCGMSNTTKVRNYMSDKGLNLIGDFRNPAYLADCKKLLKEKVKEVPEKYFSPYLLPKYLRDKEFREFARFTKGKKFFEFSNSVIEGINFDLKSEQDQDDISDLELMRPANEKRKWSMVFKFLPDKMLKHYHYISDDNSKSKIYKKFKVWLCFVSNVNWYNFYRYAKTFDEDLFSVKRKAESVPEVVQKLIADYEEFLSELPAIDFLEFVGLPIGKLIEKFEMCD